MPTRRIQRGPAAGGAPPGFQNSPAFNELYVDGSSDALVVGTGISGTTSQTVPKASAPFGVVGAALPAAVTFANLPASPVEGMLYPVTDGSVATWGTTLAGGGANHVLAYYNGTNWTVAAK